MNASVNMDAVKHIINDSTVATSDMPKGVTNPLTSLKTTVLDTVFKNVTENITKLTNLKEAISVQGTSTTPRPSTYWTIPMTKARTSPPLQIFSFDFIDSQEFQDKVASILAGQNPQKPQSNTTAVAGDDSDFIHDNLGIIIPIAAFSLFILAVVICVVWQSVSDKMRPKTKKLSPITTFYRTNSGWDSARASTRSTTPLQIPPHLYSQRDFVPKLDRISESPEDRLTPKIDSEFMSKTANLFSPDTSLASMLSRLEYELSNAVRNATFGGYSYPPPSYNSEVSQSYPNLPMPAQAPFSPYHLTWTTPGAGSRPVYSEPNGLDSVGLNRLRSALSSHYGSTFENMNVSGSNSIHPMQNTWKSPYHPNHNTPTGGSERNSPALPPNAILNHINSTISLPPHLNQSEMMRDSMHSASDTDLVVPGSRPGSRQGSRASSRPGSRHSSAHSSHHSSQTVDTVKTPGTDGGSNPNSNQNSWCYNQLYVHPLEQSVYPSYMTMDVHTLDMALSQNSSMMGMMGSSNASILPAPDMEYPEHPPPHRHHTHHPISRYPNTFALNDPALYMSCDRCPFTPAPPYDGYHAVRGTSQRLVPEYPPLNRERHLPASTNTSTCGQMDSLESSITGSLITVSRNASGYTAGPSHSTSITGLPNHDTSSTGPDSQNTSVNTSKINSISSIMPSHGNQVEQGHPTQANKQNYDKDLDGKIPIQDDNNNVLISDKTDSAGFTYPAISSDHTAAISSSIYDGTVNQSDENHSEETTSHATTSSNADNSQRTVAPDSISSLQWDSFSTNGEQNSKMSQHSEESSFSKSAALRKSRKLISPVNRAASVAAAQLAGRRMLDFEWDTYPFYSPNVPAQRVPSVDPGNTGPPPRRNEDRRFNVPQLANEQYWV